MSTDQRKLSFKWHQANGEIRRFTLSLTTGTDVYAALIAQIIAIDPNWKNNGSSSLYWIDTDNDHIRFDSTNELNEAIEMMKDISTIQIYSSKTATIEKNNNDEPIVIAKNDRSKTKHRHRGWYPTMPYAMVPPPMVGPPAYHRYEPLFDNGGHRYQNWYGYRGGRHIRRHFGLRRTMGHQYGHYRYRRGCFM